MKRRSFLLGFGATLAAPAIVRADSLMRLWVPPAPKLITDILDDYEEGTWTPTIQFGGETRRYPDAGRYRKVGKLVTISLGPLVPSGISGASIMVTGLPKFSEDTLFARHTDPLNPR